MAPHLVQMDAPDVFLVWGSYCASTTHLVMLGNLVICTAQTVLLSVIAWKALKKRRFA